MSVDPIERLRIASPCSVSWERMEGDERVRRCAECSLNVYNFAEMTREDVRVLIERNEGRVCARLYRRADGTVLTRDCPTGLRALRRRASRAAAAIVAALLSLPGFAKARLTVHGSTVNITLGHTAAPQPAAFTGVALMGNAQLPGVTVVLRDEATGRQFTAVTDTNGAFKFASLPDGTYTVELTLPGLEPAKIEHLELKSGVVTHANVTMRPVMEMGIILLEPEPVRHDPLSTTFTQSFIDKLPH